MMTGPDILSCLEPSRTASVSSSETGVRQTLLFGVMPEPAILATDLMQTANKKLVLV